MSIPDVGTINLFKSWADDLARALEKHDKALLERMQPPTRPWYVAVPFRAAAGAFVELDVPRPETAGALKVTAAARGAHGLVYVRLDAPIRLGGDGLPVRGEWVYVGGTDIQSPAIPLRLPVGQVHLYTTVDIDGTLYVGLDKGSIPG